MKRTAIVLVTIGMLGATACGGGTKVGSAFKNFQGDKAGQRIGDLVTPTPKPKSSGTTGTMPHAVTPVHTQAAVQQAAIRVSITASGFDPTAVRVAKGSIVTVTNTDSQSHSYTSSDLTYDTGQLAHEQSRTFTAGVAGKFQMGDRSRNWIIGSLEVIAR